VFLIRHATAGSRSRWEGDDSLRPLTSRGKSQAKAVAKLLSRRTVTLVASSPFTRCMQTVAPLAEQKGLTVERDKRLEEGAELGGALEVVLASDHQALCLHGDLIPAIMASLVEDGMQAAAPLRCQKGSVWEIELRHGEPVRAKYHPPEARA
jgi:8-oxo-dGTP diphosphatase